jgi:ribosomal protein L37AE/L43A
MNKDLKKCNRFRTFRFGESKKPRIRNACPACQSINLTMRTTKKIYVCERCGWKGKNIIKIEY